MGKIVEIMGLGIMYGICLAIGFRVGNKIVDKTKPYAILGYGKVKQALIDEYQKIKQRKSEGEVPNV